MTDIFELMDACFTKGASDLHLSAGRAAVLRIHGHLHDLEGPPCKPDGIKQMVEAILPGRCRQDLEQHGSADFGYAFEDKCRFRVSVLTQRGSLGMVMRLIPHRLLSFEQIGLPESVRQLLLLHRGLVLVTGPTGSGKTTTLATMVDWVNVNRDVHVITIEDPIEYYHEHKKALVTQREVGVDVSSFSEAMRRSLREDPDVILLGEMRDLETTSAAITAAETGHLVFGTLHTTGSARTVDRIIDQYPTEQQEQIRSQLAVALVAVVSQVLVPTVDGDGLVAAFEVMITNPAIENHIRKRETYKIPSVIQTGRRSGSILLDDSLLDLYRSGRISKDDMMDRAFDRKGIEARLGGGA